MISFPNVTQVNVMSLRLPSVPLTDTSETLTMFYTTREQALGKDIHNYIRLLTIINLIRNELCSVY